MTTDEILISEKYSFGATGGPRFRTTLFESSSGDEKRNLDWSEQRCFFNIAYTGKLQTDYDELKDMFYAARGRGHGFLFKDAQDFEMARQSIGDTDSVTTAFQVFKRYATASRNYDRNLTRIVAGSYTLWVNNVVIVEGGGAGQFAIDTATGIITLGSTIANIGDSPPTVHSIEFACEFYVPVRFDDDQWNGSVINGLEGGRIYSVNLQLSELKE